MAWKGQNTTSGTNALTECISWSEHNFELLWESDGGKREGAQLCSRNGQHSGVRCARKVPLSKLAVMPD